MSNHKCQLQQNKNYEVKQRYIPTFAHQQIFQQEILKPNTYRCTPTFHSTVFNTEGYNIQTLHQKKYKPTQIKAQQTQINQEKDSHKRGQQKVFLLAQSHIFNVSKDNWYDHTKQQILGSIKNGQSRQYSRERKYVDMSSDLVFTDYNYEKKVNTKNNAQPLKLTSTVNISSQQHLADQEHKLVDQNVQTVQQNQVQAEIQNLQNALIKKQKAEGKIAQNLKETTKNVKLNKTQKQQKSQQLLLKGKKVPERPHTAKKQRVIQQKPKFTVIRKSRVQH